MKPYSFEDSIRLQFNTLVKKVIDTTVKDYDRELTRRAKHETPFSELPDIMVESFEILDEYELGVISFDVYGMEVRVSDDELCEALQKLPERKRNILLMFYFLEMSDTEISELLQIDRSTSYRNRTASLKEMKKFLQED
ncbi:sigma-70 family RNA polymerase sigma factor [Clostridioides difficile]|nr:sigma-70 family RNA polymerase sigma factor [Clostridioides difficile]